MNKRLSIFSLAVLTIGMLVSCSKVDGRISEIDGKITALENEKIVSVEKQIADINTSISDLDKIREDIRNLTASLAAEGQDLAGLAEADELISDRINSLRIYLDKDLVNYAQKDIVAATYATMAQHDATNSTLESVDAKFGNLDTRLSNDIRSLKESLAAWKARLEESLIALTGRVEALEQMIQAVTIIPAGGDGRVKAVNDFLTVNCLVKPVSAVKGLAREDFTILLGESQTKASDLRSIVISDDLNFAKDTVNGTVSLKADISDYIPAEGRTLKVALNVRNDISDITTDFSMVRFAVVSYKYVEARYSTEGGPHWEFVISRDEGGSYPLIVIKTKTAYSPDFLEGDFDVESVVVQESETESKEYTGGDISISCSGDGTYDISGTAVDDEGEAISFDTPDVSAEAYNDDTGTPIDLKDKSVFDPTRVAVEEVKFNYDETPEIELGRTFKMEVTVTPADATNRNVVWSSSNPAVATVDQSGNVTAVGVGTAEIFATTVDGKRAGSCTIIIKPVAVTGVSLDRSFVRMLANESAQLTATIAPADAGNRNLIWRSSDTGVVTVDDSGLVSGVERGTATVTVTTEDGGFTASCTFDVLPAGLLYGEFSIAPGKKVRFSKGNLRYTVGTGEWSFFDKQYECGPDTYAGGHNAEISLFTWGYSATLSIIPDGFSIANVSSTYEGNLKPEHDWGRVMGDGRTWRTLTMDEWKYLLGNPEGTNCREDAWEKFGFTKVCGVRGLIIKPDTFEKPDVTYTVSEGYSAEGWRLMEAAGAVFLPSAGYRRYDEDETPSIIIDSYGSRVCYWSSTPYSNYVSAYAMSIRELSTIEISSVGSVIGRGNGCSVRLVSDLN